MRTDLTGLDLVDPAFGLNILIDEFIGGLRREKNTQARNGRQHNHCVTHGSGLLLYGL
jgi:hypothetical protein